MTEINDVTSLTKSINRIAKAMNQDFSKESLTDSLDAIADYIEENGMGGGGYSKVSIPFYQINEQTITVEFVPDEYDETITRCTISPINWNGLLKDTTPINTEGICIINGKQYKTIRKEQWAGYIDAFLEVYDQEEKVLELHQGGSTNNGLFTENGTYTISAYYLKESIILSDDFGLAVSKVANVLYVGRKIIHHYPTQNQTFYHDYDNQIDCSYQEVEHLFEGISVGDILIYKLSSINANGKPLIPLDTGFDYAIKPGEDSIDNYNLSFRTINPTGADFVHQAETSISINMELYKIQVEDFISTLAY